MTKILGLSGRKLSGKNTSANFIFGMEMCSLDIVDAMKINERGKLVVPFDVKGEIVQGELDPLDKNPSLQDWMAHTIWPFCKIYQLADVLKEICVEVLGLTETQVNGTNDDKNFLTHLLWENMPGIILSEIETTSGPDEYGLMFHTRGPMTAREVMQFVGTNIFRRMYPDVWVNTTLKRIQREGSALAIVADVRFPNEVSGLQRAGGKVIRFTRSPYNDTHASETALDGFDGYDGVIDNANMTIEEQNNAVYELLHSWNFIGFEMT